MTKHAWKLLLILGLFASFPVAVLGQQPVVQNFTDESGAVQYSDAGPLRHLVRYSAVLDAGADLARAGVAGMTFSIYREPSGGAPLWMETQNVRVDSQGHYSVLLGAATPEGMPQGLFSSGQARWLGIHVAGETDEQRVPLASVPYAIQAGDAQTLGGRAAEEFVLSRQIQREIQTAVRTELESADFRQAMRYAATPDFISSVGSVPSETECDKTLSNPKAVTNEVLYCQLQSVMKTVDAPRPFITFQLCTEPAITFEAGQKEKLELVGMLEGKVGAEVFGNGGLINLASPATGQADMGLKVSWNVVKTPICVDVLARHQTKPAPLTATGGPLVSSFAANNSSTSLLDLVAAIDQEAFAAKMLETADKLQFDPIKLQSLLDRIAGFSLDGGPLSILQQANQDRKALIDGLPMPPAVRTVLSDPASLLVKFKNLLDSGACNLSTQAPALSPLLQPICDLAKNEPFAKLLNRVDTVTGNIQNVANNINTVTGNINSVTGSTQTTVNAINTKVTRVEDAVNDVKDTVESICKVLCRP